MRLDRVPQLAHRSRTALSGQRWRSSMPAVEPAEPQLPPFDHTPAPYQGPSKEEVHALRKQYLSPALFHHFKDPIMITEGKMQYLYDDKGRRYLDAFAGIVTVSVGHCHPKVVDAVKRQSELLQHTTTIYLNPQIALYAKELTDRLPGNLKVAYFVNSGSEANDMAMLMARLYTGNYDVLALRNCYHGMSEGTMGVTAHSTWKFNVPQGFGIRHTLNPNPYTGAFGNDGKKYAEDVKDVISTCTPGGVAGFIAETIQGVGGSVPLADGYLPAAYEMVREAGGVCIADEVQTGFGRTGTNYWGFQNQGVIPDIVTMAKGIGNGLPLAAVVTTPEIAQTLAQRLHFNTYGGNPVCCAGGRAVLEAVDEDGIQANAAKVGNLLLERIRGLQQKHSIIGDVRGQGLMLGVEMVKDQTSKEPATAETVQDRRQDPVGLILGVEMVKDRPSKEPATAMTGQVMQRLRELGVLIGKGGLHGNVFRIKPPMCITMEDAEFLTEAFDLALSEL